MRQKARRAAAAKLAAGLLPLPPAPKCQDCPGFAMHHWLVCSDCLDKRVKEMDAKRPYNVNGSHLLPD